MTEYHEPAEALPADALDFHRAVKSLQEELEAVDWYSQRVAVTGDPELKALLVHNRDEEIEHACMLVEWLRRKTPGWDGRLRAYLFTERPILEIEDPAEKNGRSASLGIGSLR